MPEKGQRKGKMKKHKGQVLRTIIALLLLGVCAFSGYKVYEGWREYQRAEQEKERLSEYEPAPGSSKNAGVAELIARYPDVVGWLTVEDSPISYPFVQTENNSDYLHKTLEGEELSAGTLFMDFRNSKDFGDFNTVIYGHHMQNGSMFGTLKSFVNSGDYWDAHKRAWVFLPQETIELELFAAVTVRDTDETLYGLNYPAADDREAFLSYVKQKANRWREVGASADDRFVCLSTCTRAGSRDRWVLIGRVVEQG
jgi:sortase B